MPGPELHVRNSEEKQEHDPRSDKLNRLVRESFSPLITHRCILITSLSVLNFHESLNRGTDPDCGGVELLEELI